MKIYLIRCLCLLVVLCFTVCLMANFAFATSDFLTFEFTLSYDSDNYVSIGSVPLSDYEVAYFSGLIDSPLYVCFSDFCSFVDFVPYDEVKGLYAFELDLIVLYVDLVGILTGVPSIVVGLSGDVASFTLYVSDSVFEPSAPSRSPSLLADLQLTGESFLETVEGIVVTIGKNPLLLLTVGIFFAGGCIGIFGRFLSKD